MPEIKIKHVASFSSEDKVHKAENILKSETYRKWKCATPGEKNASIVLQFEKATKIHSIDIGNECSAFVEVLVGRSSDSVNEFQVLLGASSFMSPLESRNENHNNRVRMFGNDKLAQNLKDEKWDCVQVVCTQPFNKTITYGLSFIKFHSPPEKHVEQQPESETKTATTKLGAFLLKYDEDEDEDIKSSPPVGTSWLKNKNSTHSSSLSNTSSQEEAPSYAAAVLASTSQSKPETSGLSEYERKIQENKAEHQSLIKALKIKEAKKEFSESVKELQGAKAEKRSPLQLPLREKNKRLNVPKVNPLKRSLDSDEEVFGTPPQKKDALQKPSTSNHSNKVATANKTPFNKIMSHVVFALSGFVNPLRGVIRDKALEMGAKYKGDWDRTCSHLVCAFVNTPKYVQVRGADGRIVTKEWITDCYKRKALLPWRSYMLGKYSKTSTEEESGSEDEETVKPTVKKKDRPKVNGNHSKDQNKVVKRRARFVSSSDSDSANEKPTPSSQQKSKPKALFGDDILNGEEKTAAPEPGPSRPVREDSETEDEDALKDYVAATDVESDSGGDTEDEIRKVEEQTRKKKEIARAEENSPSEEEDSPSLVSPLPDTTNLPLPELPNLFKKRHFYLYGEFSPKKRHDLQRFITAYNGVIEDYMGDTIKYVVTDEGWDKNFEDALEENEDLIFVKSEWIFKCHEAQKLVPYQAYIVIPS